MHYRRTSFVVLAALAALAACSDSSTTAPDAARLGGEAGEEAGRDTSIAQPSYAASVRIRGHVLESSIDGPRAPGDTLSAFVPVAGARVTIYRNTIVDGEGVSVKVAEATTNADGAYDVANVPGGPYVIALNVTPDRFYGEVSVYALGTQPEITADIRIWRP